MGIELENIYLECYQLVWLNLVHIKFLACGKWLKEIATISQRWLVVCSDEFQVNLGKACQQEPPSD